MIVKNLHFFFLPVVHPGPTSIETIKHKTRLRCFMFIALSDNLNIKSPITIDLYIINGRCGKNQNH